MWGLQMLQVWHMLSRAWRIADNFCFEVHSSGLFDLRGQISHILSWVRHTRREKPSMSLVFSVRVLIGSGGRSAHGNFSLIVKHILHFLAVHDFLGCVKYPRSVLRSHVYASPIDPLPCLLSFLLLRIDILMINFMNRICKMCIIIRMLRNLRLVDVCGCTCKMCRLNSALGSNPRMNCLIIICLERMLCDSCSQGLWSIWWHLMIS
jgi:hypothetical protein